MSYKGSLQGDQKRLSAKNGESILVVQGALSLQSNVLEVLRLCYSGFLNLDGNIQQ